MEESVNLKEKRYENEQRTFFFFFFCLSLFETTEICLGSTKLEISTGKKEHFMVGKKSGKVSLPLLKNIPLTSLPSRQHTRRN